MTYVSPQPSAVNFDLGSSPYVPSVGFDFGSEIDPPGPVYPVPPGIMTTVGIASLHTSVKNHSKTMVDYARALERQTRPNVASNDASVIANFKAPQQWGKIPSKDEGIQAGLQSWGAGKK